MENTNKINPNISKNTEYPNEFSSFLNYKYFLYLILLKAK